VKGVETFFGQQVALGAFADVGENALDDLPIVWATTPAREMGHTLADRIMQRIDNTEVQAGHQIVAASGAGEVVFSLVYVCCS
jgi:LacI family transcriptional regulator of maltose regulon